MYYVYVRFGFVALYLQQQSTGPLHNIDKCTGTFKMATHGENLKSWQPCSRAHVPNSTPLGGYYELQNCKICIPGQPCSWAHFSTSRWPLRAAKLQVRVSHGQLRSCSHFSTSRCPFNAVLAHVHIFQNPSSLSNCSTSFTCICSS
jgi:hypothetical protein